jgi:hypothetical protein
LIERVSFYRASHFSTKPPIFLRNHPSFYGATHLSTEPPIYYGATHLSMEPPIFLRSHLSLYWAIHLSKQSTKLSLKIVIIIKNLLSKTITLQSYYYFISFTTLEYDAGHYTFIRYTYLGFDTFTSLHYGILHFSFFLGSLL